MDKLLLEQPAWIGLRMQGIITWEAREAIILI